MNLRNQRRLAAEVLKVGVNRVKFDGERLEDISEALTRDDIRTLIKSGAISRKPVKGVSRGRARERERQKEKGRRRGKGHRRGTSNARAPRKREWIRKIRAVRDELRKLKEKKEITVPEYRKLYNQAKGNLFQSRRHLREHIERMRR
ncbi:MAG: 50S ribosomal protein L19e [Candidatus Altiarchaeales archaeon]|nr:50S ribosomal protein L19e [Candidatus Altiarchaeales archaeon]MBD3415794.1 50S ribosomal protein L19e [Candidatus Altiarchaeales archaeon]